MRASVEEIETQIQHLCRQMDYLHNTITLLNSQLQHLEAIEQFWIRMRDLSSRSRLRIMQSDSR
jgi:prefoldin subunit 5